MKKAYDRVEWAFLFEALKQLGFHKKWINWIKECITTVSCSVIINDEVYGFFKPTREIRQVDPLSPYLFLICMQVLTRVLRKAQLKKRPVLALKSPLKQTKFHIFSLQMTVSCSVALIWNLVSTLTVY